jgi:hypothetical protein
LTCSPNLTVLARAGFRNVCFPKRVQIRLCLVVLVSQFAGWAHGGTYQGAIVIGNDSYSAAMEITEKGRDAIGLEVFISRAGYPVVAATVYLTTSGGTLRVDDRVYQLPRALANKWWLQLTHPTKPGALDSLSALREKNGSLRTEHVVNIGPGFPVKVELRFPRSCADSCEPSEIRIFSLGEWNNTFRDSISVGLVRQSD